MERIKESDVSKWSAEEKFWMKELRKKSSQTLSIATSTTAIRSNHSLVDGWHENPAKKQKRYKQFLLQFPLSVSVYPFLCVSFLAYAATQAMAFLDLHHRHFTTPWIAAIYMLDACCMLLHTSFLVIRLNAAAPRNKWTSKRDGEKKNKNEII